MADATQLLLTGGLAEGNPPGQHTGRTLAEWLNVQEQLTTRGRQFGSDTVREMLCNAAYYGYVSGRRDKSKAIKGLHEAIVPEELFDHVLQALPRTDARQQRWP